MVALAVCSTSPRGNFLGERAEEGGEEEEEEEEEEDGNNMNMITTCILLVTKLQIKLKTKN